MMLNATFSNISVISWRSVLLIEETDLSQVTDKLWISPTSTCTIVHFTGTDISIKSGSVQLSLSAHTSPLSEMLRSYARSFYM
jgi:hypothetical protein